MNTARFARICIWAIEVNGKYDNILTTIRRRQDSLSHYRDFEILKETIISNKNFILLKSDCNYSQSEEIISQILQGSFNCLGKEINYSINSDFKVQSLLPKGNYFDKNQVLSPFINCCASLTEYWCTNKDLSIVSDLNKFGINFNKQMGFDLLNLIDRIGNVLIIDAYDEFELDISQNGHDNILYLWFNPVITNKYDFFINVYLNDDLVFGELININQNFTPIPLKNSIDSVEFFIFEKATNKCIHKEKVFFVKKISTGLNMLESRSVKSKRNGSYDSINLTHYEEIEIKSPSPNIIDSFQLNRRQYIAEKEQAEKGLVFRFEPNESPNSYTDAFNKIQELIYNLSRTQFPYLYLADPYFLKVIDQNNNENHYKTLLSSIPTNKELRVLCCKHDNETIDFLDDIIKKFNLKNIKLRSIRDLSDPNKPKDTFHDRWIASINSEYGFTHSLNGWKSGGVTFFYCKNIYYALSESLWNSTSLNIEDLI